MLACVGLDIFEVQSSQENFSVLPIGQLPFKCTTFTLVSSDIAYLVHCDDPFRIWSWRWLSAELPSCVAQVPHAIHKIFLHRGKLFVLTLTESCFFAFDPLCKVLEEFQIGFLIKNMTPVGDSFILEPNTTSCDLYIYTLASIGYPVHLDEHGTVLGSHKQKAYIKSCTNSCSDKYTVDGHTEIYTLNDMGARSNDAGQSRIRCSSSFVSLENSIVSLDDVKMALLRHGRVLLDDSSTDCLLVCAKPATEEDECCTLCFCEFDDTMSAVTLDCGHHFHSDCLDQWVRAWNDFIPRGEHVRFTRAYCPGGCKHLVRHPAVPQSESIRKTYAAVESALRPVLAHCGDPSKSAYDFLAYVCDQCGNAFYGGERVCSRMMNSEPPNNPKDLLCEKCSADYSCPLHGRDFLLRSCQYCCNPATHRSFGTRYLCDRCNVRWSGVAEPFFIPCPGSESCPLRAQHIVHTSGVVGCMLCLPEGAINYSKIVLPEAAPSAQ